MFARLGRELWACQRAAVAWVGTRRNRDTLSKPDPIRGSNLSSVSDPLTDGPGLIMLARRDMFNRV